MTLSALRSLVLGGLLLGPGLAIAAGPQGGAPAPLPAAPVVPVTAGADAAPSRPAPKNETQQYCSNIAAAAADARYAWQRKQLTDLQGELKQRIADLDAKEAEFKAVIAEREALMKKANDTVVALYTKMKPDAAAAQLAAMEEPMAAAIVAQLTQQKASSIFNELPADKAAKLVAVIAAVVPEKKS